MTYEAASLVCSSSAELAHLQAVHRLAVYANRDPAHNSAGTPSAELAEGSEAESRLWKHVSPRGKSFG